MFRRPALPAVRPLLLALVLSSAAYAFIERLYPLQTALNESTAVFVAEIEKLDPDKPSCVLVWTKDLKDKTQLRRLPINLTGDKEKHTPELLKRLAVKRPVVVFVTELETQVIGLVYTEGTWFQILGTRDGEAVRWAFTHCEIYLRRTFKGTTQELIDVITDVQAGKRKAPKANSKEPPGFGPVVEPQKTSHHHPPNPPTTPSTVHCPPSTPPAWGVIALPFLAPLAALLQLLFPGLLRDQWKQYRVVISVMMTQSTLMFVHWALVRWVAKERVWWTSDAALWGGLAGIALIGAVVAFVARARDAQAPASRPAPVEYFALWTLAAVGAAWGAYLAWSGASPWDPMAAVTLAGVLGAAHLNWRSARARRGASTWGTTELVMLGVLACGGAAVGAFVTGEQANRAGAAVAADWPMYRGNAERTGSPTTEAAPALKETPRILWTFEPQERQGHVDFHSSPTVVEGQLYIGAMHQVLTLARGYVYCVNAADDLVRDGQPVPAGQRLWKFTAGNTLKPVFSSVSVADGRLWVGEGYHQDQECRLFALDPREPETAFLAHQTLSHVESTPCITGGKVVCGAGDDGLICVTTEAGALKRLWQVPHLHVDSSPVVVAGRAYVGSVQGDVLKEFAAIAVDVETGQVAWRTPAPLPLPASPVAAEGRVYFGLGAGKVDNTDDTQTGAAWCLDAATGQPLWQTPTAAPVLATPALDGERLIVASRDGRLACLAARDGTLLWKTMLDAPLVASPAVAAGCVYAVTTAGMVHAVTADRGDPLWTLELDAPAEDVYASPVCVNGRLYVAAGGKVYCLAP